MFKLFLILILTHLTVTSFAVELKPNPTWLTPNEKQLDAQITNQASALSYLSPIQLGFSESTSTRNEFFDVVVFNNLRSLVFSRFISYLQFGVYDQLGSCFILASHHIWSNTRFLKTQDVAGPDFSSDLRVPPNDLSTNNWEFIGVIPKLPQPIALRGNCASQKSNIDNIYSDLKEGFTKSYNDNFQQVYNAYVEKIKNGDFRQKIFMRNGDTKLKLYFERQMK